MSEWLTVPTLAKTLGVTPASVREVLDSTGMSRSPAHCKGEGSSTTLSPGAVVIVRARFKPSRAQALRARQRAHYSATWRVHDLELWLRKNGHVKR